MGKILMASLKTSLCINAATGKMGQQLIECAAQCNAIEVTGAICRKAHPFLGQPVYTSLDQQDSELKYSNDLKRGISSSQVTIDFSLPAVSIALLEQAIELQTPLLIGTTGFNAEQLETIKQAAKQIPILLAPNTSIGVNATLSLLSEAAKMLGHDANIEIIEAHHKHKLDAPSGTAIKMGEVICEAMHQSLDTHAVFDRSQKNAPRSENEIGFSVIRAGEIVGEHKVIFALNNEIITIEHKAQNRQCFAEGAVKAAVWLTSQEKRLYSMQDFISSDS